MSIQRFDPFRDVLSLRDAMSRLFEESYVQPSVAARAGLGTGTALGFALDVEENQDGYTVRASLPGFRPEDVQVSIVGDTLSIQAEHRGQEEKQGTNYLLKERRMGSVARTITLPQRVNPDGAQARYENGELVLSLPKVEEVRPRQIKVEVQGRQELAGGTAPHTESSGQQAKQLEGGQPATPEMNKQAEQVQEQ